MRTERASISRRDFLRVSGAAIAAASLLPARGFAAVPDSMTFISALEAAKAIRDKKVSSVELTEHMIARKEKYHQKLNAIVVDMSDKARARAKEADAALARGEVWGPLHGVPVTLKESFDVEGELTTVGFPALKDNRATQDSVVTERMRKAGGVILGKTNVPLFLMDLQAYNDIYGTTNNPWNVAMGPGGSTGGGAASLAAGLTYLEIGSDIGGSIRHPAHFCGVYGHKTSLNVIPTRGHRAGGPSEVPDPPAELPVLGPLARTAEDLHAALEIVGGPEGTEALAYSWKLPKARHEKISEYRVGYVLDDPFCPVTPEVRARLEVAVQALRKAGAKVEEGWPEGVNPVEQLETYVYLLLATLPPIGAPSAAVYDAYAERLGKPVPMNMPEVAKRAVNAGHRDYAKANGERMRARQIWQSYFADHDAFLMPVDFIPAFPHDHSPVMGRTSFFQMVTGSLMAIPINIMILRHGADLHLAILGVANRSMMFFFMPIYGLVQGLQPIIGFNFGARNLSRVREAIHKAAIIATLLSTAAFLIMMLFTRPILALFSPDAKLIEEGIWVVHVLILCMPFVGFQMVGGSLFQALGKARPAFILALSRQALILLPLVFILPQYFGLHGLWASFPVADFSSTVMTAAWVYVELRALRNFTAPSPAPQPS